MPLLVVVCNFDTECELILKEPRYHFRLDPEPASPATLTIPTTSDITSASPIGQGGRRWHHAFHLTPDLPEALVTGYVVADSGHFVPEEQPDVVARHILEHVARHG